MSGIARIYGRPNPLAYPGGRNPGFDPTHVAALGITQGHGLSVIASGGNLLNLLSGKPGTNAGTITANIISPLGPVQGQNATSSAWTQAGQSTATDTAGTFAIIFQSPNAFVLNTPLVSTTSGTAGVALRFASSASTTQVAMLFIGTGVSLTSTFGTLLAENTPYFLAGSINSTQAAGSSATVANFILVNLLTGQIQTSTASTTKVTPAAPNGTYVVGQTSDKLGYVAAAMFAPSFLSIPQLLQWAQSPWDFWYPPTVENLIFGGLGVAANVVHNQLVSVTTTEDVSLVKSVGWTRAISHVETVTLKKSVGKILKPGHVEVLSLIKSIGKIASPSHAEVISLTKQPAKIMKPTTAEVVSLTKAIAKQPLAVVTLETIGLVKDVAKLVSVMTTEALTLFAPRIVAKLLNSTVAEVLTLLKASGKISKILIPTHIEGLALYKAASKSASVSHIETLSLVKSASRAFAVSTIETLTLTPTKVLNVFVSIITAEIVSLARMVARTLSVLHSTVITLTMTAMRAAVVSAVVQPSDSAVVAVIAGDRGTV